MSCWSKDGNSTFLLIVRERSRTEGYSPALGGRRYLARIPGIILLTMTRITFLLLLTLVGARAWAQGPQQDTAAILLMDRMSATIADLHSCTFVLDMAYDMVDPDHGRMQVHETSTVYMTGPDRMHLNTNGDRGHKGIWYNGTQLIRYSFTEHNYGVMDAPDNIMATIDEVNIRYGVDFPAADLFYSSFVDDVIAQMPSIHYLGKAMVSGKECFRILAHGDEMSLQLWIATDATFLPIQFLFTDHLDGEARYQGTFSAWALNPDIPKVLYEFQPPPGAALVRILPRVQK